MALIHVGIFENFTLKFDFFHVEVNFWYWTE